MYYLPTTIEHFLQSEYLQDIQYTAALTSVHDDMNEETTAKYMA